MTSTLYHHRGQAATFTLDHFLDGDPSCGVVIVRYPDGHTGPEAVGGIERMGVNVPRLLAELQFVTEHPEQHRQAYWMLRPTNACGTAGCIAGWTVLHEGIALAFVDMPWADEDVSSATGTEDGRAILDVAADILGLNEREAHRLFAGDNTVHDLWRIARDITQGAIEIPSDVEATP